MPWHFVLNFAGIQVLFIVLVLSKREDKRVAMEIKGNANEAIRIRPKSEDD